MQYRKDIDALRGISILLVVLYHAFPEMVSGGFIGVDVFFVISGYLITTIITDGVNNNSFSYIDFYKRRIKRIFPALLTVLSITIVAGWLILFSDEFKQLGRHAFRSVFFVQNFNLIHELGYFDVSSHYKPLLHLWTLSIEEQYYMAWPIILVSIYKLKRDAKKYLALIVLISFGLNIYFVKDYKDEVFFHSGTRFWELGVGSLLSVCAYNKRFSMSKPIRIMIFLSGLTIILVSSFFIDKNSPYPYWFGLLPISGAVLFIIANVQLRKWGGLANLGLVSYSLYLWHWVVISFIYIYVGKKPGALTLVIAIVVSLFLSYYTYMYIEKTRYIKSESVVAVLVCTALVVGAISMLIVKNHGFNNRKHIHYTDKYNIQFERPPSTDSVCDEYVYSVLEKQRKFDYCREKNLNKYSNIVAVIGDSHAHALFPGIAYISNTYGYGSILLANSSCPPLKGFKWGKNKKQVDNCQAKIDQILKFLRFDNRVKKVIFTTRGPTYIHDEVRGKFTKSSVYQSLSYYINPLVRSYESYFKGFDATLNEIANIQHIQHTYYFLENPELDFLPKEVVARPFDVFGISVQDSMIDYSLYQLRMKRYQNLVSKISSGYANVSVIDVSQYLCDKNKCYAYKNGYFLYADEDHFSVYGSKYIATKVADSIFE